MFVQRYRLSCILKSSVKACMYLVIVHVYLDSLPIAVYSFCVRFKHPLLSHVCVFISISIGPEHVVNDGSNH